MHAIAAFTSEPESSGRLRLAHKPFARDAKAIMDIPPARHEPAAGRTVPGARASPTGRDAVSLANELDEEGEVACSDSAATYARPAVDSTSDEHEPISIAPLAADLGRGPDVTPGGKVLERLARLRAGLSSAAEIEPSPEEVTRPTPGRGISRPPGFVPEPVADEVPGGPSSRRQSRNRRSRQHPPAQPKT